MYDDISPNRKGRKKSGVMIVAAIFSLLAFIVITIGILILKSDISTRKKCTQEVTARVVNITERSGSSAYDNEQNGDTVRPLAFEYYYKDKKYVTKSKTNYDPPKYQLGETVKIKIDPDDPATIYDKNDNLYLIMGSVFIGVGILLIIVYIIVMKPFKRSPEIDETEVDDYDEDWGE